jgi:propanediol dehydratase small subunit
LPFFERIRAINYAAHISATDSLRASDFMNSINFERGMQLTGVEEEMILEVRLLAEASRADVTLERPRSAVHVHVRAQIAGRWE